MRNSLPGTSAGIGSAIGGLGSLAFKSDRNIKRDIGPPERILDRVKKLPVYSWRYMEGEVDQDLAYRPHGAGLEGSIRGR